MAQFTMAEFIAEHKLDVLLNDAAATKLVAKTLKERGYSQVRMMYKGVRQLVWTNERDKKINELKSKLADLKF